MWSLTLLLLPKVISRVLPPPWSVSAHRWLKLTRAQSPSRILPALIGQPGQLGVGIWLLTCPCHSFLGFCEQSMSSLPLTTCLHSHLQPSATLDSQLLEQFNARRPLIQLFSIILVYAESLFLVLNTLAGHRKPCHRPPRLPLHLRLVIWYQQKSTLTPSFAILQMC